MYLLFRYLKKPILRHLFIFENAKISNFNASDYAAFGHENVADNAYAIRQHSNGNTHINCGSSRNIEFRHLNSTQGGFTAVNDFFVGASSTNNVFYVDRSETSVGIGTYAPVSKVHIENTAYDLDSSPAVGDFHLMLRDLDSSTSGDAISIGFAQTTDANTVGAKLSFLTEASYSRGSLVFSTNSTVDTGDNTAERMRITSTGPDFGGGPDFLPIIMVRTPLSHHLCLCSHLYNF